MAVKLGLEIYEWVNRLARRIAAKPDASGIMTIPNKEVIRDLSNDILTKFMEHNVPRSALKSENDIKVIYNQIKNMEEQTLAKNLKTALTPKKSGDVLDLTGKKIDTSKPIQGGTQAGMFDNIFNKMYSEHKGGPKIVPETEAQIKTKLEGMNKKTVERIRRRRYEAAIKAEEAKAAADEDYIMKVFDPEDFAQGGRTGTGLNYLLGEDDQNSRVPYGSGGAGQPPITYAMNPENWGEPIHFGFDKPPIGSGGPKKEINPIVYGPLQVGIYGGGSKSQDVKQSTLGIGGQLDLGGGWSAKGAYDKSRVAVDSPWEDFVPVDKDSWDLEIQKKWTYADGGRIGLKDGTKFDPKRRTVLKGIAALATLPIIGKYFKWAKPLAKSSKVLTQVPINNIEGMPLWFKPLVNKVIKEGDDVTKKFATADREIVHQVSIEGKIGKDALGVEDVRVTQNLDEGTIRVEYNSPDTIGESGVNLLYKKGEVIPTKKGSVKTKDEFTASEDDFYPQATSPDGDFDLEFTENIVNKVDDLYSDTSKLKQFATGKKLTIKEISESMKKKNILKEIDKNPNDHAFRNVQDYDGPYDEFASGGRVPLFGGGAARKLWQEFIERQFLKASNDIRQGKGIWQGLTQEQWIKKHDDLTKTLKEWEMGGKKALPKETKEFFGMNEIQLTNKFKIETGQIQASKPIKTLEGIEKTGTINISDPAIADEFTRFMKETDPKGFKDLEQKVELSNFDPKGRKKNAFGGLAGMLGE